MDIQGFAYGNLSMADAYLMWELESVSLKVFLSHSNDHCAPQSGVGSAKKKIVLPLLFYQ